MMTMLHASPPPPPRRARVKGSDSVAVRAAPRPRIRSGRAGRAWWVVLAVVAGLFAMHGLEMQGMHLGGNPSAMHSSTTTQSPDGDMPVMQPVAVVASDALPGMDPRTVSEAYGQTAAALPDILAASGSAAEPEQGATGDPRQPAPAQGMGLLGLCLALIAVGLLLYRSLSARRVAWATPRDFLSQRLATLAATARGPSPPLRAELSIWRC